MRRSSACERDRRRNTERFHRWQTASRTPSRLAAPEGHRPHTGHRCRARPTYDREGESEASPLGWHGERADTARLGPLRRTPFGADAHDMARRHAVGKEVPSQMPEDTTPDASTRNPVEGDTMLPRSGDSRRRGVAIVAVAVALALACGIPTVGSRPRLNGDGRGEWERPASSRRGRRARRPCRGDRPFRAARYP
jgi:hypothetical protein